MYECVWKSHFYWQLALHELWIADQILVCQEQSSSECSEHLQWTTAVLPRAPSTAGKK